MADEKQEFMIFAGPMLTSAELIEALRERDRLLDEDGSSTDSPSEGESE